jgi:Ca2+-binding EF-hand superfamily protein
VFINHSPSALQSITQEEFRAGCERINKVAPDDQRIVEVDHMLKVLDFDGNGSISVNEFFEASRILGLREKATQE